MSDLGIMDYLMLNNNDKFDVKEELDILPPSNYDNSDLMSSDFFDSILTLDKTNLDEYNLEAEIFNNLDVDMNLTSDGSVNYDDSQNETSTFSDSGMSSNLQDVSEQILSDDELLKSITNSVESSKINQVSREIVIKSAECIQPVIRTVTPNQKISIVKPNPNSKQIIRVKPMTGNARSMLLPINIKDLKSIKILNNVHLKPENIKFTSTPVRPLKKLNEKFIIKPTKTANRVTIENVTENEKKIITVQENSVNAGVDIDTDGKQYPLLVLTAEEKRLLSKDGIQLPARYPLTKQEERELKRIRRKIRNKISAQDSRKRKKEYVDGLEERVKQCSEENRSLIKRIKLLQLQNNKLSSQLSKLQSLVYKTGTSRAHPATCLLIVLLSAMLVTLPNIRNNGSTAVDKELNSLQQFATRRALLFSQQATNEDSAFNMDELISFPPKNSLDDDDLVDPSTGTEYLEKSIEESFGLHFETGTKIDYGEDDEPGGADVDFLERGNKRYIDPDIDDVWPPMKKQKVDSVAATPISTSTHSAMAQGKPLMNFTEYY